MTDNTNEMLLPLTSSPSTAACDPSIVGGKGASLAKLAAFGTVPQSFGLTVAFFDPWVQSLQQEYAINNSNGTSDDDTTLQKIQERCLTLSLNAPQQAAIQRLRAAFGSNTLVAVRSSAPQEDGAEQSFAGAFSSLLGVSLQQHATQSPLEDAIRACFASRFDPRVMAYSNSSSSSSSISHTSDLSFAVVVMEMVDADAAGVAFTANPLNSDRDELVVDASFGLGESVVDGSVQADRFIYDKINNAIVEQQIGTKTQEIRLSKDDGGTSAVPITDTERQSAPTLSEEQLQELAAVLGTVEEQYGMPMDVEWAYTAKEDDGSMQLYLLQARPITTLFTLDEAMMTKPGERRKLYYDYNIVADATTTTPFTLMDMEFYCRASSSMMGFDHDIFSYNTDALLFKASTRQYANLSFHLKFFSKEYLGDGVKFLDPYTATLFASKDCDREKYRMKKLPKSISLWGACKLLWQFPWRQLFKNGNAAKKDPEQAKTEYMEIVKKDLATFKELDARGRKPGQGLQDFANELYDAMSESFGHEIGILFLAVMPLFKELDKKRREGETEEIRSEYDALCGGYEGDELMQMNIDIYRLANLLPEKIWAEYPYEDLGKLAHRIRASLEAQNSSDLPVAFLDEWRSFMERHGWDGQDQLFPSCPRYRDDPVLLLAKLRQNVGAGIRDPADIQREQVDKRREAMASQKTAAEAHGFWCRRSAVSKVQQQNECLEHLMWIRNAPKMHLSNLCGILRTATLKIETEWLASERLEARDDIFQLSLTEIDQALEDPSMDVMALIRPRKVVYERALRSNQCPLMVDSRCRIIKPDPPTEGQHEPGTLVGAAVSPGVASGRVRIVLSPADDFEKGEVLVAVVTNPAWTPLFVGASAIVLQIGGVLQHGALCAREFGKPAVSNIDISKLENGVEVSVDGNTGVVKILDGSS